MIMYIQEGDRQTAFNDNTQQLCLWEQLLMCHWRGHCALSATVSHCAGWSCLATISDLTPCWDLFPNPPCMYGRP